MPTEQVKTIKIVEEIYGWGYTFKDVVSQTRLFDGSKIIVPVNSYGGAVTEGMAIYNYLKGLNIEVEVRIVGYAMSMGTIICCAANKVVMPENSWYMIHNPTMGKYGDLDDMESGADLLKKMTNDLAEIYNKKTGLPLDQILAMMKKETWLTGKEALAMGFVDELSEGVSLAAASADKEFFSKLNNVPEKLSEAIGITNSHNENSKPMDKLFAKLTAFFGKEINASTTPEQLDEAINAFNQAQTDKITNLENSFAQMKKTINESLTATIKASLGDIVKNQVNTEISTLKGTLTDTVKSTVVEELKPTNDKFNDLAKEVNSIKAGKGGNQSNHSSENNSFSKGNQGGDTEIKLDDKNPISALANFEITLV